MNRRWIALTALVLVVVGGIAAVIAWDKPDDWGNRHDRVEVVRVVDDDAATTAGTGDTIVIERGRGFFPFGIFFIPLGFLFVFLIARAIFGRPGPGGPWRGGPPPEWLDDWHRRQHEASDSPPQSGNLA